MRFIAFALLALCLVQGNNAQFGLGAIKSVAPCWMVGCDDSGSFEEVAAPAAEVAADAGKAPAKAVKAPVEAVKAPVEAVKAPVKAAAKAASAAVIISNMPGLSVLTAKPEAMVKAALDIKSKPDDVLALAEGMSVREHLELTKVVKSSVTEQAQGIARRIQVLTQNTAARTGCAEKEVKVANKLATAIMELPSRATALAKESIILNKKCQQKPAGELRDRCSASELAPMALRSTELVKETHQFTAEAMNEVKLLRNTFDKCTKAAKANKKK